MTDISLDVLEHEADTKGLIELDWEMEKRLIEQALDDAYRVFLDGSGTVNYEDVREKPLGRIYQKLRSKEVEEEEQEQEFVEPEEE